MSACPDKALLLGGLLDGELDAANSVALEAHLAACPGCMAELERLGAVRDQVRQPGMRFTTPAHLRDAVGTMPDLAAATPPARGPRLPSWLAPGVMGALAASLALFVALPQLRPGADAPSPPAIERELVASHVRSLLAAHLTDIQTSNEHVVRPWFNGKIDFAPPVPELAAQGFPLVGGRLDYIAGRVVPAIVYRRRLHSVNLFVWPDRTTDARAERTDGYSVLEWTQDGLRYAAVSDIDPADLARFRAAFVAATRR